MGFNKMGSNKIAGIMKFVKTPRKDLAKMKMSDDLRNAVYKIQDAAEAGDTETLSRMANQLKDRYAEKGTKIKGSGRFDQIVGTRTEKEMLQDVGFQKLKQQNFGR